MSQHFKNAKDAILFWKMAIIKCSGKALMALLLSIVGTLNGVEWSEFTPTQHFIAIVVALGAMWTVVDAFLSDTMTKLQDEREEQIASDTAIMKKQTDPFRNV